MLNKNIFRFVSVFSVLVLAVVVFGSSTQNAYANTCTAATGNWNTAGTWSGCGGVIPTSADAVVIPGNVIVTVNVAGAVANTVSVSDPIATGNNGITIASPGTLTVTGAVTIVGSSGASNSTIAVADGALTAANFAIADGATTGDSVLSVSTGSITTTGTGIALTVTDTADVQLLATSTGIITLGGTTGTITATGTPTVTLNSASTVTFTGTGAQTVPVYTYGKLTINKASGTASLATGTISIAGNLTVTAGTLDMAAAVPTVSGVTDVQTAGTLAFSSATGLKTFTGSVGITGTWNETAAVAVTFASNLANSGTFTASTGVHTFGTGGISGTLTIPSLTGTAITNNGTLTVSTTLAGTLLTNAASSTLNIGDASSITTLTATASGNTVAYTKAGAQTVHAGDYYNLTLTGSGEKTMAGARAIGYDLVIDSGVTLNTNAADTVSGGLKLGGSWKSASSYGFTGSGATNIDTTYFSTGTGVVTNTLSHSSGGGTTGGGGGSYTPPPTIPPVTPAPTVIPGCTGTTGFSATTGQSCAGNVAVAGTVTCSTGQVYDAATGARCTAWTTTTPGTTTSTYAFGTGVVKLGSKGNSCKAWQMYFNDKGHAGLTVDGWCGKMTIAFAKTWQASAGLTADGKLGAMSRAKAMSASMMMH